MVSSILSNAPNMGVRVLKGGYMKQANSTLVSRIVFAPLMFVTGAYMAANGLSIEHVPTMVGTTFIAGIVMLYAVLHLLSTWLSWKFLVNIGQAALAANEFAEWLEARRNKESEL